MHKWFDKMAPQPVSFTSFPLHNERKCQCVHLYWAELYTGVGEGGYGGVGCPGADPCWCCSLLEEGLSSLLEWRAFEINSCEGWRAHKVLLDHLQVARVCMQFSVFSFTHMHAVLVPVLSVCCCEYRSDCSHHGSPCSKHETQADR